MKFVKVDDIPVQKGKHQDLRVRWKEFMAMNVKTVRLELDEDEYKSLESARTTFIISIKRSGYPIMITRREDDLYLIRKDL